MRLEETNESWLPQAKQNVINQGIGEKKGHVDERWCKEEPSIPKVSVSGRLWLVISGSMS
jgi:hypothetical protein